MNGENNHIFHTSALEGQPLHQPRTRLTWRLFVAQLWLIGAFAGMSLFAIAARLVLTQNEAQPAAALALGLLGAMLTPVAWWNIAHQLERYESESAFPDAQPTPTIEPSRIMPAKPLLLASHR